MSDLPPWHDLTHAIRSDMTVYPGDPRVAIGTCRSHGSDGYQVTALKLGTHSGTHIDAPLHFVPDGRSLDSYPVHRFHGHAIVIDARGYAPCSTIGEEVLSPVGEQLGQVSIALFCTGWDRYFGDERYLRHPFLSVGLAYRLVDLGVKLVGVDTLNPDLTGDSAFPVHDLLLRNDVLIAENLRGLEPLVGCRVETWLLPLNVADADGAPVRAVARRIDDDVAGRTS